MDIHYTPARALACLAMVSAMAWAALSLAACDTADAGTDAVDSSQIVLLAPLGGEELRAGDSLRVKWKLQGKGFTEVTAVGVLLSPDDGMHWEFLHPQSIRTDEIGLWGNFAWAVRDSLMVSNVGKVALAGCKCLVRVKEYTSSDPNKRATSKNFTIKPK